MIGKQALAVLLGRVRKKKIRVCSPAIFKRVVNTRAGRFRRIDPPGEAQKPLRNRRPIIVDDIVDIRLGQSARRLRHRCKRLPSYSGTEHLAPACREIGDGPTLLPLRDRPASISTGNPAGEVSAANAEYAAAKLAGTLASRQAKQAGTLRPQRLQPQGR
jgi:hypothetical protein